MATSRKTRSQTHAGKIPQLNQMTTRILLFVKHNLPFIWQGIDQLNVLLFRILHEKKMNRVSENVIRNYTDPGYTIRRQRREDLSQLEKLLTRQAAERVVFFKPHNFDYESLEKVWRNPSFLMMGVFDGPLMVGYFFLRCFWNEKCFVGRLIDEPYERRGIGRTMNDIMYNIAWQTGFRCLSTISRKNHRVMKAHAQNQVMKVLKNLSNDYLLVEFIKPYN